MDNTISAVVSSANSVPLISVALPVYNGEQHLAESIESILGQSFSDFEFIIINDGSTDGSLEILRKYEQAHPCIRLVSRENRNVAATLNEIAQMARGEWIARIDQDDIAVPDRFEKQLQWLAHTGADICGSWIRTFGAGSELVISHAQSDAAVKMEMLFCSPLAHPSVMMRKSVLSQLQYNEVGWQAEDYDLWVRAAEAGWKMTNVPEVLLRYRQHANQISTKSNRAQQSLSCSIRRRYWHYVFTRLQLDVSLIDEVLKLRDAEGQNADMDRVVCAFSGLLSHSEGEARLVVFDHMRRLFIRAAAACPNSATRWQRLCKQYEYPVKKETLLILWLLSVLRIGPDGRVFHRLKAFYLSLLARF